MEEKLKEIFTVVRDFVKFAEAKNAGIIVFNGGAVWASLKFINDIWDLSNPVIIAFICFALNNTVSLIVAFWSMLPIIKNETKKGKLVDDNDNLIFFGHIAQFHEEEYLNAISEKYGLKSSNHKLEKDLANQLIRNSQIALRKFDLFNTAIWWTFASIFVSVFIYIISFFLFTCQCGCKY